MKATEVEVQLTPEELLDALWWSESGGNRMGNELNSLDTHWKLKSLYLCDPRDGAPQYVRLTLERKPTPQEKLEALQPGKETA